VELTGAKGVTEIVAPSRAERTIARRSAEARATIPDLELSAEVDMTTFVARGLPIDAALVRACAAALRENPLANGSYRDGNYELHSRINVGITIETEDGFVVPTVLDADQRSLAELETELELLAARAGEGELSPPELSGATFTVSNPGHNGVARAAPIIISPQAAALAAGAIRSVPVVRGPAIVPGHVMTLTLACDHRILFGSRAARFLGQISALLEDAGP
jgi:pyruvate dehydrogenase E2 component (dihydrolipoamide acetyltransferase)